VQRRFVHFIDEALRESSHAGHSHELA
jgi:hypothetical protein